MSKYNYGWKPDLPDNRDFLLQKIARKQISKLPKKVDLRKKMPLLFDQGELGSCTANAISSLMTYEMPIEKRRVFSRLFIYFNERQIEHTINSDSGAQIRDGIKSVSKIGCCPEDSWPYIISKFRIKPTNSCYAEGMKNIVTLYSRVPRDLNSMKSLLANKKAFVFGFSVYESFESDSVAKTGVLNLPKPNEKLLGGHAVMCVGYNDKTSRFIIRNSWGDMWGNKGYFTMPYEYLLNENLSDDFWSITI